MANIRALSRLPIDPATAKALDVGCGSGTSLLSLLRLGFHRRNLSGVDINPDRISGGIEEFPNVDFRCESADQMSFPDNHFDLVIESTMFVQITNDSLANGIAREMMRVTAPGKYIVLTDWRYGKPRHPEYKGVSTRRIRNLFLVGLKTEILFRERGALVPPIGRFISRRLAPLYFMLQLLPFAPGQMTTVLMKL